MKKLHLVSEKTTAKVMVSIVDDFPSLPQPEDPVILSVPNQDLLEGIQSVAFAAETTTTKPELSSILILCEGSVITFVATDSFRLAEKNITPKNSLAPFSLLLPAKNALEIVRLLADKKEVTIGVSKDVISFSSEGYFITSRLVDGTYPDYKQIIPQQFSTLVFAESNEFQTAVKGATIFSDRFNKVTLSVVGDQMEVSSQNSEVGENATTIKITTEGDDIKQNFDYRFLSEAFTKIKTKNISIGFTGPARPIVVRPKNDTSYTYLLMPMNR